MTPRYVLLLLRLLGLLLLDHSADLTALGLHDELVSQPLGLASVLLHNLGEVLLLDFDTKLILLEVVGLVLPSHLQSDDGSKTLLAGVTAQTDEGHAGIVQRHSGLGHDPILNQVTAHPNESVTDILVQTLDRRLVHQHILNDARHQDIGTFLHEFGIVLEIVIGILVDGIIYASEQSGLVDLTSDEVTHVLQNTHGIYLLA